jgi:hypothetical protein
LYNLYIDLLPDWVYIDGFLVFCDSGNSPAVIASCFRTVLFRCRFPKPKSGGAVDGGGGSGGVEGSGLDDEDIDIEVDTLINYRIDVNSLVTHSIVD